MKSALALRHVYFEDLGTLGAVLEGRGYRLRYLDVPDGLLVGTDVLEPDLVVCLGGPIGAYETDRYPFLRAELAALEGRLARARATLGICLGSQLMARALGARVYPSGTREIGFAPVRLTAEGAASCLEPLAGDGTVLHWHGDTFDLPKEAIHLARSDVCENQAFSVGSHALALQFHVEVEPAGFERWLVGHACELASAGIEPGALRSAMVTHGPSLARKAEAILLRWLDQLGRHGAVRSGGGGSPSGTKRSAAPLLQ